MIFCKILLFNLLATTCLSNASKAGNCKIDVRGRTFEIPFATLEKLDDNSFLRVACFNDPESQEPVTFDRDPELFSVILAHLDGADVTKRLDVNFSNLLEEATFFGLTDLYLSLARLPPRKRNIISTMIKMTPLEMMFASCKSGNVDLFEKARLLTYHDMSVFVDHQGRLPLGVAAMHGKNEVVGLLLQYGAFVDAVDNLGQTALMYAARNGHVETIELLASTGADIYLKNNEGYDAFSHAFIYEKHGASNALAKIAYIRTGEVIHCRACPVKSFRNNFRF